MKMMTKAITLLAAAACFGGQSVNAGVAIASPQIISVFAPQVTDAKTKLGQDGNLRLIWDLTPGSNTYSGSVVWLFDNMGNFISAGSPMIPADVGYNIVPSAHSNIIMYGQASGNTTLAFLFPSTPGADPVKIGIWTYNSAGALISTVVYGPFANTTAHQVFFDELSGKLIIQWRMVHGPGLASTSVWTFNEFGAIDTQTPMFGPFGKNVTRGKTQLINGIDQVWFFDLNDGGGNHSVTVWRFNAAGFVIHANTYPF